MRRANVTLHRGDTVFVNIYAMHRRGDIFESPSGTSRSAWRPTM
jgi:cytochrome P450